MRLVRFCAHALLCVLLAACGGGGGGGGSGGGGDNSNRFTVHLVTSSLTFDFLAGTTPAPQVAIATWTGDPPAQVYLGAIVEGAGINPVIPVALSSSQASATIRAQNGLAAGDYTGRILFLVCSDQACANRIGGSPLPIPYTVRVRPRLFTNAGSFLFQHVVTGPNAPGGTLTTTQAATSWTASANVPWLTLSRTSGAGGDAISVSYNATGLADGTHNARITVTSGSNSQSIDANLIVSPPTLTSAATVTLSGTLGAPVASQPLAIALETQATTNWAATVSAPWVTLSKTSGSTPDTLNVGFDLARSPVSGTHQATIRFTATVEGGRALERIVNVALDLQRPTLVFTGDSVFTGINGTPIAPHTYSVALSNGLSRQVTLASNAPWIMLGQPTVTTGADFSVSIDAAIGNLSNVWETQNVIASVQIGSETISGSLPIQARLDPPQIHISHTDGVFRLVNGSTSPTQQIEVVSISPVTPELTLIPSQPWIRTTATSAGNTQTVALTVDPSVGPLSSGRHTGLLRLLVRVNGYVIERYFSVTLDLDRPTLSVTPSPIVLGGSTGRETSQVAVAVSLDTDTKPYTWSVSGVPAWVTLDRTSGSASATPGQLQLTPRPAQATPGTTTANLTFSAVVNGDVVTRTVPVDFNLDAHRVFADRNGVALSSTPGWSRLSDTIRIKSNYDESGTWTAVSDRSWLNVTSAGPLGGMLQVTANPSGLPTNQVDVATVTITPNDPALGPPERVRVGLWVGASTPASPTTINGEFSWIAADPVRPYVYVHGAMDSIRIFNVYTRTEIGTLTAGGVAIPGAMTVSSNGSHLYVVDQSDASVTPIDLATATPAAKWLPRPFAAAPAQISYARPSGGGVVIGSNGQAFSASDGTDAGYVILDHNPPHFATSGDSSFLFNGSGRAQLDFTSAHGGELLTSYSGPAFGLVPADARDIATNLDGSIVGVTGLWTFDYRFYDGVSMSALDELDMPSGGSANNVEISPTGKRVLALSANYGTEDFWIYGADGALSQALKLGDDGSVTGNDGAVIVERGIVLSGDGMIAAVVMQRANFSSLTGVSLWLIPVGP